MKRQFFGTDGVRGTFGGPVINPSFAAKLAFAAGLHFRQGRENEPTEILVGRDTRASGLVLEAAILAGLQAAGCQTFSLGILPTPAVSRALRSRKAAGAVVITASHNPAEDNGIKFFGPGGIKLSDETELAIEALLAKAPQTFALAELETLPAAEDYVSAMCSLLPAGALRGWRIVVDTANGATSNTTPAVLRQLGADLICLGDKPDGANINAGVGSEHPEQLAAKVREERASLGIAHDGDGDRCILCDENGDVLDGDEILVILATHALRQGKLGKRTLVVTVQSNLGVDRAISNADGRVLRTPVGDRYVVECMLAEGSNLGGESSGHIVCSDISPTGDGLVAALKVIEVMLHSGLSLSTLRGSLQKFPQLSRALRVKEKKPLETLPTLPGVMAALEKDFGRQGRLLVRYSGTEAKLRLLVEGPTQELVEAAMGRLEAAVRADLEVV